MAITASDITAIRLEYGDTDSAVFSDPEITTIWDLMASATSTYEQRRATIGYMFLITRNSAVKMRDYSQGESSEKGSQVFKQLQALVDEYQSSIDGALGTKSEIARNVLRPKPHQEREYPHGHPDGRPVDRVLRD